MNGKVKFVYADFAVRVAVATFSSRKTGGGFSQGHDHLQ